MEDEIVENEFQRHIEFQIISKKTTLIIEKIIKIFTSGSDSS